MASFFKPNKNLDKDLQREPRYTAALAAETKKAEGMAKNFAPEESGDYKRGIKVVVKGKEVFLSATDWKSHWIEWGIPSRPEYPISAPLRRGVRAAGLKFKESSK